jgi:DegV family protein with EDD domain
VTQRVAIITDSTACLSPEETRALNIQVVPVSLVFPDGAYRDGDQPSESFNARLKASPRPPTTSAPAPVEYLAAMRAAAKHADSILVITVSPEFSAMLDSAQSAATQLHAESPEIELAVLDSRSAAMAQGYVALVAAQAADNGASLAECIATARKTAASAHLLFAIKDLHFLARGGRVPHVLAWAAGLLDVHPLVHFHDGKVNLLERVRTGSRSLSRLCESIARFHNPDQPLEVAIQHAGAEAEAEKLAALVRERYQPATLITREFTQVMTAHTGPGLVGLAFCSADPSDSPSLLAERGLGEEV